MTDTDDTLSACTDPALASFVLLAQFLGVPADPAQIHHDRGQGDAPYAFDDLVRVAKRLGLMARKRRAALSDLPKMPLPALALLADGSTVVLLKADDGGDGGTRYMVTRAANCWR